MPRGLVQEITDRARPYTRLTRDTCVSHLSAAAIHGISVPFGTDPAGRLHLSRRAGQGLLRRPGIAGHRLKFDDLDVEMVLDMPVTGPARTFVDLGTLLGMDDLVAAGDSIVSEHQRHFGEPRLPLLPLENLRRYVERTRGLHGIRNARQALDLIRVGVDSPPETRVRLMLGRAGLPDFVPNCPVVGDVGFPVWADLGCPEYKTCVEYEGGHHLTPQQQLFDAQRDERTAQAGWKQVKLNKLDLRNGQSWVAARVIQALRSQGWSG